ncbi:MAG: sugar transferase [Acidimicrobiaceae bacterium]|nr:sugar transferase [Acidimicrobiaceae bacterium]
MKRFFDIVVTILSLVILSPIYLGISILIFYKMGFPLLFRQTRPGKDGNLFEIIKFRTMLNENDRNGKPLPDEDRLTSFGVWLRSTSLDELPELINVLRGDMSIVGPRPLLIEYLPLYSSEQARRHNVRPGITGWAQVNGRNAISWKKKFELDVWYVDNNSIWLDIKIISMTFLRVMVRSGIDDDIGVGQEKFKGNQ